MSTGFDWQTEEKSDWEELVPVAEPQPAPRPRRRLLWLFLASVLVATTAIVVYQQLNLRVDRATISVESEALATHSVAQEAAVQGDREILVRFLSGASDSWAAAQEQLVLAQAFYDRGAFGLKWRPGDAETAVTDVTLSPDLTEVEVVSEQKYELGVGGGLTETVTLQHTAVYRRGPNHWLLSPPKPGFWGETLSSRGHFLTVSYPARDAEIGRRLAGDLEARLTQMCAGLEDLDCPTGLVVNVTFSPSPQSMLEAEAAMSHTPSTDSQHIVLPAPTLVGLPIDERGYQALLRGYAAQVVAVTITDVVGYQCCAYELLYRTLLDTQLRRLNLRSWPLTADHYAVIADEAPDFGPAVSQVSSIWPRPYADARSVEQWWLTYALIDFVLERDPDLSATQLQQELVSIATNGETGDGEGYPEWVRGFTFDNPDLSQGGFTAENWWRQFVYAQLQPPPAPPLPLPQQDIALACADSLFRYDLAAGVWQRDLAQVMTPSTTTFPPDSRMQPLPDDSGVLFQGIRFVNGESVWQAVLWRAGKERVLFEAPADLGAIFLAQLGDVGRRVLIQSTDSSGSGAVPDWQYRYLALNDCLGRDCPLYPLTGPTFWSPDGSKTLVWEVNPRTADTGVFELWRGSNVGQPQTLIGTAFTAFWLDNDTYGYVRPVSEDEGPGQALMVARVADDEPQLLLQTADLRQAFPDEERPPQLFIQNVIRASLEPDLLFVVAANERFRPTIHTDYLFSFDTTSGDIELRFQLTNAASWNADDQALSPDGRWLAWADTRSDVPALYLHQFERDETRKIELDLPFDSSSVTTAVDWSADGQWLVSTTGYGLQLIAIDHDYQRAVVHGVSTCENVAWVDRP